MCLSAFTHLTGSHLEHVPRSLRTIFFSLLLLFSNLPVSLPWSGFPPNLSESSPPQGPVGLISLPETFSGLCDLHA